MASKLEDALLGQIVQAGIVPVIREFVAIKGRRFRWDFWFPDDNLLVEVQGGVWGKGGHSTGAGITKDCEKLNLATIAGYRQLHVTGNQIKGGEALGWIQEAIAANKW